MRREKLVSTFMTHDMDDETVLSLSTGREDELDKVVSAIQRSIGDSVNRQHIVIYGERGAGKSFLMRLAQIQIQRLADEENEDIAFVLLPEEQIGMRSAAQLLRAIRMRFEGEQYVYVSDKRTKASAFTEEARLLSDAIDDRFGTGKGLVVAAVENYDVLSQRIFGKQFGKGSGQRAEQREDEERFRKLLGSLDSRLLLIAAATRTVDMDYERPLFKAFEPVELAQWTPQTCVQYFQKRRSFMELDDLDPVQEARAKAVSQFIAGNPRLAHLLCDVLEAKDPMSIADIFDSLSEYLSEYYQAKLKDFSDATSDLLNALIFGGEPCTQTELAERAGLSQSQIATTFSALVESRILVAEKARIGRGKLYRVRDRLFVYFYRKRLEIKDHPSTLIRMSELLASFFSADEKAEFAVKSIRKGEIDDAQLYIALRNKELGLTPGMSSYAAVDACCELIPALYTAVNIGSNEAKREISRFCNDQPASTVRYWEKLRGESESQVEFAARTIWLSIAYQRCGLDEQAESVLQEAVSSTLGSGNTSSFLMVANALVSYSHNASSNIVVSDAWALVIANFEPEGDLTEYARYLVLKNRFYLAVPCIANRRESQSRKEQLQAAIADIKELIPGVAIDSENWLLEIEPEDAYEEALKIASDNGWIDEKLWLLIVEAYVKRDREEYAQALSLLESIAADCVESKATRRLLDSNRLRVSILCQMGRIDEALEVFETSVSHGQTFADDVLNVSAVLVSHFLETEKPAEAIRLLRRCKAIAETGSLASKSQIYCQLFRLIYKGEVRGLIDDVADANQCLGEHFSKALRWYAPEMIIPLDRAGLLSPELWCQVELEKLNFGSGEFADYINQAFDRDGRDAAYQRFKRLTEFVVSGLEWLDGEEKFYPISQYAYGIARRVFSAPLLRDIADYFEERDVASGDSFFVELFRILAEYHDSEDKPAFLQRIDPDMRTSVELVFPQKSADELSSD